MTTPLTDEQLTAIETGLEGVTPGPWKQGGAGVARTVRMAEALQKPIAEIWHSGKEAEINATAFHIARLDPTTVAAWIARDKAQRAMIAELEAGIDQLKAELDALEGREPRDKEEK